MLVIEKTLMSVCVCAPQHVALQVDATLQQLAGGLDCILAATGGNRERNRSDGLGVPDDKMVVQAKLREAMGGKVSSNSSIFPPIFAFFFS